MADTKYNKEAQQFVSTSGLRKAHTNPAPAAPRGKHIKWDRKLRRRAQHLVEALYSLAESRNESSNPLHHVTADYASLLYWSRQFLWQASGSVDSEITFECLDTYVNYTPASNSRSRQLRKHSKWNQDLCQRALTLIRILHSISESRQNPGHELHSFEPDWPTIAFHSRTFLLAVGGTLRRDIPFQKVDDRSDRNSKGCL